MNASIDNIKPPNTGYEMKFLRIRKRRACRSGGKSKAADTGADASVTTASVNSNGDCSLDDSIVDDVSQSDKCCSALHDPSTAHTNCRASHSSHNPDDYICYDDITQACKSVIFLRDSSGQPYHRCVQCCASLGTPAWKRHSSIAPRLRTRFIDEALGLPSAVTGLTNYPRTKKEDIPAMFYSKKDVRFSIKEGEGSGHMSKYAKKLVVNGKIRTVGEF